MTNKEYEEGYQKGLEDAFKRVEQELSIMIINHNNSIMANEVYSSPVKMDSYIHMMNHGTVLHKFNEAIFNETYDKKLSYDEALEIAKENQKRGLEFAKLIAEKQNKEKE